MFSRGEDSDILLPIIYLFRLSQTSWWDVVTVFSDPYAVQSQQKEKYYACFKSVCLASVVIGPLMVVPVIVRNS